MPHIVINYSANLDLLTDMQMLCNALADTLLSQRAEDGSQVFPTGGVRVFAYPTEHCAIADGGAAAMDSGGNGDYGFVYLNLRMGAGRSAVVHRKVGDALLACAGEHLDPVFKTHHLGLTVQIDESPGQVYDGKRSTLHPLFNKTA